MNPQYWSWILTAVGVCSLYLAGRRSVWGWAVGIGANPVSGGVAWPGVSGIGW